MTLHVRCIECDLRFTVARKITAPEKVNVVCPWCEESQWVNVTADVLARNRRPVAVAG